MRRPASLLLPLVASLLLTGCPRPPNYIPSMQALTPPGKEAFADQVYKLLSQATSQPQMNLALRQLGLSPNEIGLFEKAETTDGKLDNVELRDAFDMSGYINEERNRFFSKGPDTNQTLPADLLPSADRNGDHRLVMDEWLYEVHYVWLRSLQRGQDPERYQRKVVVLWKRPDLNVTLENLAPRLFSLIDTNPLDRVVSGEELAGYSGINNEATFTASQQGKPDIIDPQGFARLLQRSQATFLRNLNDYFTKLDKLQIDGMVSKNELAAAVSADPQSVAAFIQLPKETTGRIEFEKAILKAAVDKPIVQKAVVKWAWSEAIPDR